MDALARETRLRLKNDFAHYASRCLKIRTKNGSVEPFILNKAQLHIHNLVEQQLRERGIVRAIILKGRQMGCSTYIGARYYWRVTHKFGVRAFILAHEEDATRNLFEMTKRYHKNCPDVMRPSTSASNAIELVFDKLDSGYRLGTAGNKGVGRSSTVQYLHASECAYYKNAPEIAKGIMQTVPSGAGTEIIIESTANGVGNYFHQQWQLAEAGLSDYLAIFEPWFWQDEYQREVPDDFIRTSDEDELVETYGLTDTQLCWRRYKIVDLSVGGIDGAKLFRVEYPCNPVEAFMETGEDCFIAPEIIAKARKCAYEPVGPLFIGVDPARFGDDRTALIRRRGRHAFGLQTFIKKDTMEVAGIVHRAILDERPARVFVDIVGLGAGVYDRLKELGHEHILVACNAGSSPLDGARYYNKRAEGWATTKQWMMDGAQIPDSDELHADLAAPRYTFDSQGRLKIERKEDLKKRGIRSSDTADALCLTHYEPEGAHLAQRADEEAAARIMSRQREISRLKANR